MPIVFLGGGGGGAATRADMRHVVLFCLGLRLFLLLLFNCFFSSSLRLYVVLLLAVLLLRFLLPFVLGSRSGRLYLRLVSC
jgi:hypothetical protein